jgi:hypothetical protein
VNGQRICTVGDLERILKGLTTAALAQSRDKIPVLLRFIPSLAFSSASVSLSKDDGAIPSGEPPLKRHNSNSVDTSNAAAAAAVPPPPQIAVAERQQQNPTAALLNSGSATPELPPQRGHHSRLRATTPGTHPVKSPPYTCPCCGFICDGSDSMMAHMHGHTPPQRRLVYFVCQLCDNFQCTDMKAFQCHQRECSV